MSTEYRPDDGHLFVTPDPPDSAGLQRMVALCDGGEPRTGFDVLAEVGAGGRVLVRCGACRRRVKELLPDYTLQELFPDLGSAAEGVSS